MSAPLKATSDAELWPSPYNVPDLRGSVRHTAALVQSSIPSCHVDGGGRTDRTNKTETTDCGRLSERTSRIGKPNARKHDAKHGSSDNQHSKRFDVDDVNEKYEKYELQKKAFDLEKEFGMAVDSLTSLTGARSTVSNKTVRMFVSFGLLASYLLNG